MIYFKLEWLFSATFGNDMFGPMADRYRLAGLILAAILVVALQLAPRAAFAHPGHHHQQAATHQHASAERPLAVQGPAKDEAAAYVKNAEFAASDHPSFDHVGSAGNGCLSGLGCCCMASALAGAVLELPPLDSHIERISFSVRQLGGIDPEALARPPKFFA